MNALVIGVRRTGKSTLGYFLAVDSGALLIVIWDPNNNFRAFPVAYSAEQLERLLDETQTDDKEEALKVIPIYFYAAPRPRAPRSVSRIVTIRYVPKPNNLAEEFEQFSEVLRDKLSGHWALLIDESDEDIQTKQKMSDSLAWWMRRAPTEQDWPECVEIVQMTHSPQDVYTRARNLLTDVYVFRTNGQAELEWLEDYTQNPEVAQIARTLSTPTRADPGAARHVLHIFDGVGGEKEFEVLTDAREWYIQIGSNRGTYGLSRHPKNEGPEGKESDAGSEEEEAG